MGRANWFESSVKASSPGSFGTQNGKVVTSTSSTNGIDTCWWYEMLSNCSVSDALRSSIADIVLLHWSVVTQAVTSQTGETARTSDIRRLTVTPPISCVAEERERAEEIHLWE